MPRKAQPKGMSGKAPKGKWQGKHNQRGMPGKAPKEMPRKAPTGITGKAPTENPMGTAKHFLRKFANGLFYNDSFDTARNGGQDLVRDRAEDVREFGDGRVFAKDGDGVADLHVETGYVKHGHVHADVADGRYTVAVDGE